jgi:hypothetical protein
MPLFQYAVQCTDAEDGRQQCKRFELIVRSHMSTVVQRPYTMLSQNCKLLHGSPERAGFLTLRAGHVGRRLLKHRRQLTGLAAWHTAVILMWQRGKHIHQGCASLQGSP